MAIATVRHAKIYAGAIIEGRRRMTPAQADEFIMRCRRVLTQWQNEIESAHGEAKAEAARDSLLETLREIAAEFPAKASKIGTLINRFRQRLDG